MVDDRLQENSLKTKVRLISIPNKYTSNVNISTVLHVKLHQSISIWILHSQNKNPSSNIYEVFMLIPPFNI